MLVTGCANLKRVLAVLCTLAMLRLSRVIAPGCNRGRLAWRHSGLKEFAVISRPDGRAESPGPVKLLVYCIQGDVQHPDRLDFEK